MVRPDVRSNSSESANLVETVLTTVADVDNLDHLRCQPGIEHVTLPKLSLEVGTTSQDQAGYIDFVGGDEVLNSKLGDLADVVMPLLVTQTRETQRGLPSTAVLLGEIDDELVDDVVGVASDGTKEP